MLGFLKGQLTQIVKKYRCIPFSKLSSFDYGCVLMYNSYVKNRAGFSTLKEISRILGNPDGFRVIFGKWNNSRKFHEIHENMTFMA